MNGSYLPNGRSNLVIAVHALSLLLFKFTVGLIRSFISRWQSHSPTRLPCLVTPHPHPIFRCNCCNPNTACITYLVNEPDLMESDLNDALKVFFKSRKIPLTANSISSSSGNSSSSSSSQSWTKTFVKQATTLPVDNPKGLLSWKLLEIKISFLWAIHSLFFSSFQHSWQKTFNINFANGWIWTVDHWSQKRLLLPTEPQPLSNKCRLVCHLICELHKEMFYNRL